MKKEISIIIMIITLSIANFNIQSIATDISTAEINGSIINNYANLDTSHREEMAPRLNLKKGDITWCWATIFPLATHCLIYTGENRTTNYGSIEYHFIEANGIHNVWDPWYDENWIKEYLFTTITRVNTSSIVKDKAIEFAYSQVGTKFMAIVLPNGTFQKKNNNPNDPNDPYSDEWYCTELIWAAYYNNGVDIDRNDGTLLDLLFPAVTPNDIRFDNDIDLIQLYEPAIPRYR